jgi:hypothetical protein
MVETNPSDEEVNPYYHMLDSGDEEDANLAQLWMVSQEEEPREETAHTHGHFTLSGSYGMTTHPMAKTAKG